MSSDVLAELRGVWKKYSYREIFHRSIRDDIMSMFKRGGNMLKEDEFWALSDIDLRLLQGECVGLYGPNGAGKTTILKLIASITYPTRGDISINGRVAPFIEIGAGFHPDLTGRENIYVNGTIIGMKIGDIRAKMKDIIEFSELERFIDMPIKKYSSGMYLKLGFSIAAYSLAEILLFDEILSVSDEYFQNKCVERIRQLKRNGRSIVIVSHNKALLNEMADNVYYINKGTTSLENLHGKEH